MPSPQRRRRRIIDVVAVALSVLLVLALWRAMDYSLEAGRPPLPLSSSPTLPATTQTTTLSVADDQPCNEDQPCWVWSQMGNRKRGVGVAYHAKRGIRIKHLVVGPCRYQLLALNNYLTSDTPRLKGDSYALNHGCDSHAYPRRPGPNP